MNIKFAALLAVAALSVAACEQQAATPQQASAVPAADTASVTPADAPSAPQTLTSSDNAVSISVTGNFQDQLGGNALPEGAEAGTILQQYDENTDITLTVVDAGKPVKPAKEYYANLKTAWTIPSPMPKATTTTASTSTAPTTSTPSAPSAAVPTTQHWPKRSKTSNC